MLHDMLWIAVCGQLGFLLRWFLSVVLGERCRFPFFLAACFAARIEAKPAKIKKQSRNKLMIPATLAAFVYSVSLAAGR